MRFKTTIFSVLLVVSVIVLAVPSEAIPPRKADAWNFGAAIYGWLPSINGTIALPTGGGEEELTMEPSTILDDLKMTAQFGLEAEKNNWSIFADVVYMSLGEEKSASATLPGGNVFEADLDVGLKSWIVDLDGGYTVYETERNRTQVLFGVRYLWMETKLDISTSSPELPGGSLEASSDFLDFIVGLRGYFGIGGKWSIPYRIDMGAGGSEFTWKGQAGIDYSWKWGGVTAMYRYLEFDEGNDKTLRKMDMPGPLLGFHFQF